jgi:penicillin-binding protein 1C
VDAVQAERQAGSTLKPFAYELAIERKYLTAASVLEDSPLSLPTPNGLYTPQNYEGDFKGAVTARTALASSLNVPAVRVVNLIGVDNFWSRLRELGFSSLTQTPDFYGYSLALGSADVSLWMLANAYRSLANKGMYSEATFELGKAAVFKPVMNEEATFIINDILSDRSARATTFGLENPLATPFWTAVKTGTSKDMRDNWCIGFSQRYTVAVWVGNMDGSPMRDVSGITGAAPLWAAVMQQLEGGLINTQQTAPIAPLSLKREKVVFKGVQEPPREEWFLPNTEMQEVVFVPQISAQIIYPVNETIIAIDPDIPFAQQRVRFRAEAPNKNLLWWLDGRLLGKARELDWLPTAGRHRLVLKDAQGRELDAVFFTVRGAMK